jgi:NADPH:quinone reductase-like Zn-dependent oxidoreductase
MSAREIHLTKNGDAETATFSVDTVPEKVAGPGEVVVKITTAPCNPADIFSIMGVCEYRCAYGLRSGPGLGRCE